MNTRFVLVFSLLGSLACSSPSTSLGLPSDVDLHHHVATLADDAMEGRRAGSRGEHRAAEYLIEVFEHAGLSPAGPKGSWFQDIGIRGYELVGASFSLPGWAGGPELVYGREISALGWAGTVGEFEIVRVTSLDEVPATPSSDQALLIDGGGARSSWEMQNSLADGGEGWGCLLLAYASRPGELSALPGEVALAPGAVGRYWLRGAALDAVRAGEATRFAANIELDAERPARNVLASLSARADSPHADEWVIVTAHYDHVGTFAESAEGDRIFNGANDDAAGVAVLLEWAEALAEGPEPERNVLFLPVTAEEVGLLGSEFYVEHPTVPLEKVVAVLNLEMLGQPEPLLEGAGAMFLTGYALSSLGPSLAEAGLPVGDDPRPQLRLFERSDNFPFVQAGIVAHTLSSGGENETYHQVSDETDTLDFEHLGRCARSGLQALHMLLSGELTPSWSPQEAPDEETPEG